MSKPKRSLEDAFALTPAVSSFLNNEKPEEVKQAPKQLATKNKVTPSKKPNPTPKVKKAPAPVLLVPYSTRLPNTLVNRLVLCAAQRKLERKPNCTQQDIATQAISEWLNKHE